MSNDDVYGIYEDKFEVGQHIRSYDFEGRDDCYVEGEIIAIHKGEADAPVQHFAYEIEVSRKVMGGKELQRSSWDNVFAPMLVMFEYEGRLELV